jgi:hypothetical protein
MKLLVLIAALAVGGCKKQEEAPAPDNLPPAEPITASEAETGRKACQAYVDQICGCTLPEAASECEMAKARPGAFDMNVRAAMAEGNANLKDRRILIANSRKIMRGCIEDAAAWVTKGCPLSPAPAPAE